VWVGVCVCVCVCVCVRVCVRLIDDKRHGYGKLTLAESKDVYEGQWVDGKVTDRPGPTPPQPQAACMHKHVC
jgi:hypothetical protein